MAYEGFVTLGGVEIVNNARATTYASPVGLRCSCGELAASLGDTGGYTSPAADLAPWFDDGAPESGGFWGLAGLEITGADAATTSRQWTELIGDGGVPGASRAASREVEIKALAAAADEAALNYGIAWLSAALQGSACRDVCAGDELCLYTACPTRPVVGQSAGDCDAAAPPDEGAPVQDWDPALAGDHLLRSAYNVATVEGPAVESRRRLSGGVVAEVSFTVKAGVPYWWRQPTHAIGFTLSALPSGVSQDLLTGYDPITALADCTGAGPADCLEENPYEVAPPYPAEPVVEVTDPSYPTSRFSAARIVFTLPGDANPDWLAKVPILRISSGSLPMHRFTVRWYDNPLGYPCLGANLDPCEACAEVTLPWMPRSSTLTIDGRTHRAALECPGRATASAEHALYGPRGGLFTWPEFDCAASMCVEILADSASLARDVSVAVDFATREDTA